MKTAFAKFLATSSLAITALAPASAMAAGSASLTLGASATQVTNGSTVVVSVSASGPADVVTAKISYDATKLSCSAASVAASGAFSNKAGDSCGGGSAVMSHYVSPGSPAASGVVGTITFTAIADAGTAVVSTTAGSQVASAGANNWNGALSSVSITLNAPAATAPGRGSVSTGTQQPTAPAKTTKPAAATSTASTTDTAASTEQPAKTEPQQVAAATDSKPASQTQATTPAKASSKTPVYVAVAILAVAAAAAFVFRSKLSALLNKAKEA